MYGMARTVATNTAKTATLVCSSLLAFLISGLRGANISGWVGGEADTTPQVSLIKNLAGASAGHVQLFSACQHIKHTMADIEVKPDVEMKEEPDAIDASAPPPDVKESTPAETVPANPLVAQYNEQWKKVSDSPSDFTAWTNLIATAEKLDELERLRGVYEAFLASYPLCFGYWKKFSDAEHRHQNIEGALSVYERGVSATPYSMDLWGHYATYKKNNGGSADDVRGIYERALAYCGSDYLGHQLWDKYIHFEEEQGSALHVVSLYCRAITQPLRELNRYMSSLKTFIQGRNSSEVMTPEEANSLMEHLTQAKEAQAAAAAQEAAGEEAPPAVDTSVSDDEVKASWLAAREPLLEAAKKVAETRRPYEEGIKRAYFHVKVLDTPQLTNWVRYLDHTEAQQPEDIAAVVTLYERCLVACASYPEFWERYVRWLDSKIMTTEADSALQRATTVFCRTRPEIFIFAARHAERRGQVDAARAHLKHVLDTLAPGLLAAVAASANFERRQGHLAEACNIWESALDKEKNAHKESEGDASTQGSKLYAYMAIHFATFLREVAGQIDKARQVLHDALSVAPQIRNLYEAALHLELSVGEPGVWSRVTPLFEKALAEPTGGVLGLSEKDREDLSARQIEIADTYGDSAAVLAAEVTHSRHFTLPSSFAAAAAAAASDNGTSNGGRKRSADSYAGAEAAAKAAKLDNTPTAAAGAPPAAAHAAYHHAGYPPAAAAPAYSGYPPQAYGAYGAYAAYGQGYSQGHYGYGY